MFHRLNIIIVEPMTLGVEVEEEARPLSWLSWGKVHSGPGFRLWAEELSRIRLHIPLLAF